MTETMDESPEDEDITMVMAAEVDLLVGTEPRRVEGSMGWAFLS